MKEKKERKSKQNKMEMVMVAGNLPCMQSPEGCAEG